MWGPAAAKGLTPKDVRALSPQIYHIGACVLEDPRSCACALVGEKHSFRVWLLKFEAKVVDVHPWADLVDFPA